MIPRLMKARCPSCIFGPNSPIGLERFADLREQWTRQGAETYQVCHATAVWNDGEDPDPADSPRVCRGFWEEVYIKEEVPIQALQIAERLGLLDE